jgi:hypothetical protein
MFINSMKFLSSQAYLYRSKQSGVDLRDLTLELSFPLKYCGGGFESQSRHECLYAFIVVCVVLCAGRGLAMD